LHLATVLAVLRDEQTHPSRPTQDLVLACSPRL